MMMRYRSDGIKIAHMRPGTSTSRTSVTLEYVVTADCIAS